MDGQESEGEEELRILTADLPQYFAIVTRVRVENQWIGEEGGVISSKVIPQVQAVFPQGALNKKVKVGLQAQPVSPDLISKMFRNRVACSPIVTFEPRRREHNPAIWEDITQYTTLQFVNDCVFFTTAVSILVDGLSKHAGVCTYGHGTLRGGTHGDR